MEKSEIETIYRKYFHDVFLYIRALSENESLAEEITQETFLKAMNNIEKFDEDFMIELTDDEVEDLRSNFLTANLNSKSRYKKNQIDADSIYGFLGAFNEVYSECTDAEKKQFMQAFIERIDIFQERREDGNWIQNIKFQFPVPIIKEGREVAQIKGISLDKEKSNEHMVSLEKLSTLETVVLMSRKDK